MTTSNTFGNDNFFLIIRSVVYRLVSSVLNVDASLNLSVDLKMMYTRENFRGGDDVG